MKFGIPQESTHKAGSLRDHDLIKFEDREWMVDWTVGLLRNPADPGRMIRLGLVPRDPQPKEPIMQWFDVPMKQDIVYRGRA